jgi:hypothetical protein
MVRASSLIRMQLLDQLDFVEFGPEFAGDQEVVGLGQVGDAVEDGLGVGGAGGSESE